MSRKDARSSNARLTSIEVPSERKRAGNVLQAKEIKQTSLADDCLGELITVFGSRPDP
jgi:hypothetical protein